MRRFVFSILLSILASCSPSSRTEKVSDDPPGTQEQQRWTPFNDSANALHPERKKAYHVEKYGIHLKIFEAEPKTEGRVDLTLRPLDTIGRVRLDAGDMKILSVKSGDRELNFNLERESLWIELGGDARREDSVSLSVAFEGHPARGLFWVRPDDGYPDKPSMVWSQGETEYNHFWFPCYDYPNDRALSETWFTVPSKYTVISNGALIDVKDEGDGWSTHHWLMDVGHASYLTSVVVGDFEKYEDKYKGENGDVSVLYFVPKGQFEKEDVLRTFAETPEMIKFYSENIGTTYAYPKYAQTTAWDFIWGGMENISATTLFQWTVQPKRTELDRNSEGLIAHELAHQWFGDLLTCRSWAHIWLNEGFATYFQILWDEHRHGVDAMMEDLDGGAQGYFGEDSRYRRPVVCEVFTNSDDMFDSHTYPRGAWVLHMLRRLIGDAAWWKGIRLYVKKNARANVDTRDFQSAMEDASGQDLRWFFDQWLYKTGYPEFRVTQTWDEMHKTLKLAVEQTHKVDEHRFETLVTGTPSVFKAPVDIEIETKEGKKKWGVWVDHLEQDFYFPLDSEPLLVEFDSTGSVLKKVEFKKSVRQLIYQLRHDDESVGRKWAADQLASLSADTIESDRSAAVEALKTAVMEDKWYGVQIVAANSLAKMKGEAPRAALLACVHAKEARVRRAVLDGLGSWASDDVVQKAVSEAMENDESWACESAAAISFGKSGAGAYERILKLYADRASNPWVSPALLQGLVETKEGKAISELIAATAYGKHPWLRRRAIELLGRVLKESKDEEGIKTLIHLLEDKSYHARAGAIAALAELGDRRAIEPLKKRAQEEFDARLRRSASDAIRRLQSPPK